jgi:hypothetical protein
MPLKESLKVIKLQPASGKGEIAIRNIKLLTADGYLLRDWPIN